MNNIDKNVKGAKSILKKSLYAGMYLLTAINGANSVKVIMERTLMNETKINIEKDYLNMGENGNFFEKGIYYSLIYPGKLGRELAYKIVGDGEK